MSKLLRRFRNAKYYILHRWVWRSHLYPIRDIEKGEYYDIDEKLFLTVFSMLVDYVEIEVAQLAKISATDYSHPDIVAYTRATWTDRWINRDKWNERLGLAHLEWEMTLESKFSNQALAAKEIRELYLWYKHIRPKRFDPDVLVPDPLDHELYFKVVNEQRDEDDDKLCRVIRARHSMWT